jgi:hypothetical protein
MTLTSVLRRYGRDAVPNTLGTAFGLAPIATAKRKFFVSLLDTKSEFPFVLEEIITFGKIF